MAHHDEARMRAHEYANRYGLTLDKELGHGVDGIVFTSESQSQDATEPLQSAVKASLNIAKYERERDVYLRLEENQVERIRDCNVPQLIRFDDDLMVIEMTIVQRPFVLDFGGAYLDRRTDFSEEVMADWYAQKVDQFGKYWGEVQSILRILEAYGIFVEDVHPGNISFPGLLARES